MVYFFLTIDLYFLTTAVTEYIFNPIEKLVIPIEISSEEAKTETEMHPITTKAKIKKRSTKFRVVQTSLFFLLID